MNMRDAKSLMFEVEIGNKTIKVTSCCGILNLPPYHMGELMHGYLQRTAMKNGFNTVDEFMKRIQNLPKLHYKAGFTTGYDAMTNFQAGIRFTDDFDWLRSGTLFSTLYSFSSTPPEERLKEYQKNYVFRGDEERVANYITELYVCPDCMREEGEDWYYHTALQMPYLTCCPKHGTRLLRYTGPRCQETDNPQFEEIPPFPQEKRLSEFSKAILENDINCSVYGTILTINTKFRKLIKPCDIDPLFEDRIEMLYDIPFKSLENLVDFKKTLQIKQMIALVAYLFETPEDFLSTIPKGADFRSEFMVALKGKFKMLTPYRNDAVKLQCLNCGDIFYVNPPAFIRNPTCSKELNGYE